MSFEQMENVQGGMTLSLAQYAICAMIGFGSASCTFGAGAAFGYLVCISLLYASM